MDEPQPKLSQWWRWPLMPVAALVGALAGTLVIVLFLWIGMKFQGGYSEDGWYFRYVVPALTSGCFGYLYAKISYHVAPSGKIVAGTVMVTLLGVLGVLNVILSWALPQYSVGQAIQATVGSVTMLEGAVVALTDN